MPARTWPLWPLVIFLVVTDFTLHLAVGLGPRLPDLVTVAVLIAALRLRPAATAGLGLVLGFLRDALSIVAFGADAVVLTVIGYLAARSRDLISGDSTLFMLVYLFAGTWAHHALYYLVGRSALRGDATTWLLGEAMLSALSSAITGAVVMYFVRSSRRDR